MSEIEHQGTVAMTPASARNSQEDFFRGLAAHYMDALTQIIVTDDLSECHRLAGIFLGSNPPPVDLGRGVEWPVGEARVVWFDPLVDVIPRRDPYKIIDASLWFMDKAEIGERLYTKEQVEDILRRASLADLASRVPASLSDVVDERRRQTEVEGFDASHDDMATRGQLALAGACYAYEATRTARQRADDIGSPPPMWPWDREWWKPTDRRRDLVKAAALIIAEIERLDRAALSAPATEVEQ